MPGYFIDEKVGGMYLSIDENTCVKIGQAWYENQLVYQSAFNVTYVVDEGVEYVEKVKPNTSMLSPTTFTPEKSGYEFLGWRRDTTASEDILTDENALATEHTTLYAVFRQTVTGTFKSYNSTQTDSDYKYYNNGNVLGASITYPTGATYSGFEFRGWSAVDDTSADADASKGNGANITDVLENFTVYGLYRKNITVTYYNNSTSASSAKGYRYYNASGNNKNPSFTLNQAGKSGWTARGWSTSNAGNATATYSNGATFTRDSDITLYGMYYASITLSYAGNGATSGTTQAQPGTIYWAPAGTIGASFTLRSCGFSRSGYSFTGWNLGSAGATITLTSSSTATAQWKLASQSFKVYMKNHDNYDNGWEDLNVKSIDSNNYFSKDSDDRYLYCKASCNVSVSYTYNNGGGNGRLWMRKYYAGSVHEWQGLGEGDNLSGSASFSVNAGEYISWQTLSHYATGDGQIVMSTSNLTFTFTATAI